MSRGEPTPAQRDYAAAARQIVDTLGEPAARNLLRLLDSSDQARAEAFRAVYERGGNDALLDTLTDLEGDPLLRGWIVEHLRMVLLSRRGAD